MFLALVTQILTACGKPHDQTLSITCSGSVAYTLNQYVDRKDDGTCTVNGHTTSFQFKYDGDAERYNDFCVVDGLTVKYIDGVAKVIETGEVLSCK
jgi:predicted secreted Zn-dependent protease